jgi:hypothetical protein
LTGSGGCRKKTTFTRTQHTQNENKKTGNISLEQQQSENTELVVMEKGCVRIKSNRLVFESSVRGGGFLVFYSL